MINVNQITAQMARMSDPALQQYAAMHKSDPYTLSLALSESNRRKEMRQGAQAGQQQPQPKVVDQEIAQMGPQMPPQQGAPQGMPQGMPPHQLPEDVGIGQLPAPNMQRMATGGIVAFEEGGEVPGYAGGVFTGSDPFDDAFRRVMRYEGGYVANDAGKGPSKFGINKAANSDLDIAKLTEKDAKRIYRERYWDKIGGDELAKKNPALAAVAFDTAVNMGVTPAKKLVEQSGGDPSKILAAREQHYASLIKKDPETFAKYQSGWQSRLADLATSVIPSAAAAEPRQPAAPSGPSLVDRIPGQTGAVPEPARTKPLTGNEMVTGAGETALQYGTGLLSLPFAAAAGAIKPGVPFEQAFSEAHKGMTYSPRTAGGQEISEATSKALSGLPAIIPGATTAGMARGPLKNLPASTTAAREALSKSEQARAPRLPYEKPPTPVSAAPEGLTPEAMATRDAAVKQRQAREQAARAQGQQASMERQTQDITAADDALAAASARAAGDRAGLETLKKETDYTQGASNRAQNIATGAVAGAAGAGAPGVGAAGGLPDMAKAMNLDEESRVIEPAAPAPELDPKDIKKIGKEATPKDERKGMSGEDFLMIGLGILSGQSPHALTNIGEGGLKGLQMAQAGRKIASEEAYHKGMLERYATPQALQMALAYNDPEKRKAIEDYVRMEAQTKAEPMTKQKLFQEFIKTPAGQVGEFDKFDTYMQQWENRFGPIGGGLPKGTAVTRIG
jgi:lysozyme family protein